MLQIADNLVMVGITSKTTVPEIRVLRPYDNIHFVTARKKFGAR